MVMHLTLQSIVDSWRHGIVWRLAAERPDTIAKLARMNAWITSEEKK
jgi:hypothetical protein